MLTTAELAIIIEDHPGLPEDQRKAIAHDIRTNTTLDMAFAVERYLRLGYKMHDDRYSAKPGASALAGEDFNKDASVVRKHHKKYRHLF